MRREAYYAPYYWLMLKYLQMQDKSMVDSIPVFEEWKDDFEAFKRWAIENDYPKWDGELEKKIHLERADQSKGFYPDNCHWRIE